MDAQARLLYNRCAEAHSLLDEPHSGAILLDEGVDDEYGCCAMDHAEIMHVLQAFSAGDCDAARSSSKYTQALFTYMGFAVQMPGMVLCPRLTQRLAYPYHDERCVIEKCRFQEASFRSTPSECTAVSDVQHFLQVALGPADANVTLRCAAEAHLSRTPGQYRTFNMLAACLAGAGIPHAPSLLPHTYDCHLQPSVHWAVLGSAMNEDAHGTLKRVLAFGLHDCHAETVQRALLCALPQVCRVISPEYGTALVTRALKMSTAHFGDALLEALLPMCCLDDCIWALHALAPALARAQGRLRNAWQVGMSCRPVTFQRLVHALHDAAVPGQPLLHSTQVHCLVLAAAKWNSALLHQFLEAGGQPGQTALAAPAVDEPHTFSKSSVHAAPQVQQLGVMGTPQVLCDDGAVHPLSCGMLRKLIEAALDNGNAASLHVLMRHAPTQGTALEQLVAVLDVTHLRVFPGRGRQSDGACAALQRYMAPLVATALQQGLARVPLLRHFDATTQVQAEALLRVAHAAQYRQEYSYEAGAKCTGEAAAGAWKPPDEESNAMRMFLRKNFYAQPESAHSTLMHLQHLLVTSIGRRCKTFREWLHAVLRQSTGCLDAWDCAVVRDMLRADNWSARVALLACRALGGGGGGGGGVTHVL